MTPQRRHFAAALAAMAIGPAFGAARAQSARGYPTRPITLWIPWPAGGATDLTLRVLAELAAPLLGQKIIVENRPGAGGTLAMPVLQQAAPDGYTIAQMPQPVFRAPWVQKLSWNPIRDTTAIIQVSGVTFGIVVPASSPFHSLEDLLQYAQKHPGEMTVSTNGVGTTPHLVIDDLMARRRTTYVHVPYKGTAEQMVAVASGQVMVGVNSNGFAPFVDMGKLRLLVTFGEQRTKRWPQVPTLKELGFGIVATSPYGLAGPRGLPEPVVRTLHQAFKTAMFEPAHIAELARYDQELAYLGPEDYARAMREAYQAERRTAERLGLARAN
ncbi:MAG TPA: tripartite tricarboxylate transporter substrate binding protein [Burkholderiaceae bacterium]|nr:tripartite tricarboxylate transporter substrate binding protein [Burkholderiaceae bacterium]